MISRITTNCRHVLCASRKYVPPLNFITIHYAYFIVTCLITSLVFWGSSTPPRSVTYTDSLFLIVSAMTEAGLNTVNLSQLNTFQQWLLWFHILIGSAIFVSAFVVQIRKRAFESRFKHAQKEERRERKRSLSLPKQRSDYRHHFRSASTSNYADGPYDGSAFESRHSQPRDPASEKGLANEGASAENRAQSTPIAGRSGEISMDSNAVLSSRDENVQTDGADRIKFSEASLGRSPMRQRRNSNRTTSKDLINSSASATSNDLGKMKEAPRPTEFITSDIVGRNSQFHGLTREEREALGGVEYRAIKLLSYIVPVYLVAWQLLSCLGLGAYMAHNKADVIRANGINPW